MKTPSPEHEMILAGVRETAKQRLLTIIDAQELREQIEKSQQESLRAVQEMHREANRQLIAAIEDAHTRGIRKSIIYEQIGLSSQRLGQIRRAVNKWESEKT